MRDAFKIDEDGFLDVDSDDVGCNDKILLGTAKIKGEKKIIIKIVTIINRICIAHISLLHASPKALDRNKENNEKRIPTKEKLVINSEQLSFKANGNVIVTDQAVFSLVVSQPVTL